MNSFTPRSSFASPLCVPKTYFLGHHCTGLQKIKSVLSNVSLVLECRDFRLPLSTRNPKLEQATIGCERLIVYTKVDLGSDNCGVKLAISKLHGDNIAFWSKTKPQTTEALLRRLHAKAREIDSLAGLRVLIVGMPNVGKSSLLNALRSSGLPGKAKAAKTGDQAGVTRRLGSFVRIIPQGKIGVGNGIFAIDSPGIFQPFVNDGETMIKVALVQGVKKGVVSDDILADYLLFKMNLWNPLIYSRYREPTNHIHELLAAVSRHDGKLKSGGVPNLQEAASRFLSQWRNGFLGKHVLDDLSGQALTVYNRSLTEPTLSLSQAKKRKSLTSQSSD